MSLPVLVTTDFSALSESAYPFAARFARAHGLSVRLVHVSDIDVFHGAADRGHPWERDLLLYIEERLADSANRLRALGVEVETRVRIGIASKELLAESREGVSLAVLATRGHGGLLRAILGSVAAKFVQHATVPVLAVPQGATDAVPERVLFPIDFSELTNGVLGRAIELLAPFAANVELFHAHPPIGAAASVVHVSGKAEAIVEASFGERLSEYATHCNAAGLNATWQLSDAHSPAGAILERADVLDTQLIVMAGHGRRGLERLLLGSVAEAVVRRAHQPVLVLKAPDGE